MENAKQLRYGYAIVIVSFYPVALFLFENGGAREKGRKKRNAARLRAQNYGRVAFEKSSAKLFLQGECEHSASVRQIKI